MPRQLGPGGTQLPRHMGPPGPKIGGEGGGGGGGGGTHIPVTSGLEGVPPVSHREGKEIFSEQCIYTCSKIKARFRILHNTLDY